MRTKWLLGAALALAMAGSTWAGEGLDKLLREYEAAQQAFYAKIQEMQEQGTFDPSNMPAQPESAFAPRFREFAVKHAGTTDAIPALTWLVSNPAFGPTGPDTTHVEWAFDQLAASHAADPAIAQVMPNLPFMAFSIGRPKVVDLCETIIEVNGDREVQAGATFALAVTLYADFIQPPEGRDVERATKLFKKLASDYAGTEAAGQATAYVYEIEHLQVGMKAPEIMGKDPTGREIKLSQFKGQVVVLDFWGFW